MEVRFRLRASAAETLSAGGKVHERAHHARCPPDATIGRMAYVPDDLSSNRFASSRDGTVTIDAMFVPPNADGDARLKVQLLQNVLHVLLHGA